MAKWRSRIVGSGEEAPDQLLANPYNFRVHGRLQQDALAGVLSEIGWIQQVLVNRRTGHLIDGHLRVSLALRHNEPTVPVLYVDVDEAEERLVLATLDPIAALAQADAQKLDELLHEVSTSDPAVQQMLSEFAEQTGLPFGKQNPAGEGGDEFDSSLPDGPTICQPGDLWQLGEHRLVVGDCTDAGVVARLMDGGRAEMVWTDPPYGVAISDKNKYLNSIGRSRRTEDNLANDALDESELLEMLRSAFAVAASVCLPGAAWYVAAPAGPLHLLWGQSLNELGIWRQTIQWVKNNATLAPLGADYHWRAEPIFYGWLPGAAHRYYGGRKQDTVWEIARPTASPDHPTMKPIELVARAVENSSLPGDIIYDAFAGSGTTMIACERLNRRARLCEIDPRYSDVILRRYQTETGDEPVLLERLDT